MSHLQAAMIRSIQGFATELTRAPLYDCGHADAWSSSSARVASAPRASRSGAWWAPATTDSRLSLSCCPTRVRPSASCLRDELVPVARRAGVRARGACRSVRRIWTGGP
jgi:hypothetical protein